MNFAVPEDQRLKLKESKKEDKYLELAREGKTKQKQNKTAAYEVDGDTNCNWCSWNGSQESEKERERGGIGNQRKNRDHPYQSIG